VWPERHPLHCRRLHLSPLPGFAMPRLSIRIDFEPSGSALGPGMVRLLEGIERENSLRGAARSLNMSYRKAWGLIQDMHATFQVPVVKAEAGGLAGGCSQLTDLGRNLVRLYRRIESEAEYAARADMESLEAKVRPDAPPRGTLRSSKKDHMP